MKSAPKSGELPDDAGSAQWLDAVLDQTLAKPDDAQNQQLLNSLLDVRRQHLADPFDLPVGEKMVSAVLSVQLGSIATPTMSSTIAETLANDPTCRQRLESLWNRLGTAVREG